jgi:RpiB/LacA/LacB family sugar-phosphate isomerase
MGAIMKERIVISSDHAGFELKNHLKPFIESLGYEVDDIGTFSNEPVDYPKLTFDAARRVISGNCSRGIVFCGTGQGDVIVANKVPGIRAALCWNEFTARMSRSHNNSNMLVLGGWVTGQKVAEEITRVWLSTPFEGGRHERRIKQIVDIETAILLGRGKTYDITQVIRPGMLSWPGDPKVVFKKVDFEGVANLTRLDMSAHSGTHVDAPSHILRGGTGTDGIALDCLVGLACVCDVAGVKQIDPALLERKNLSGVSRLLLKSNNSALLSKAGFEKNYAFLTEDAALYLVDKGLKFLAVYYLSVDAFETSLFPVHRTLLHAGVAIVEGVDLSGVPEGDYELICLPLKLESCDGSPARVILRSL